MNRRPACHPVAALLDCFVKSYYISPIGEQIMNVRRAVIDLTGGSLAIFTGIWLATTFYNFDIESATIFSAVATAGSLPLVLAVIISRSLISNERDIRERTGRTVHRSNRVMAVAGALATAFTVLCAIIFARGRMYNIPDALIFVAAIGLILGVSVATVSTWVLCSRGWHLRNRKVRP